MSSVTLDRIIPAEELLRRWPGLVEEELADILNFAEEGEPVLRAYWHDKTLIKPDNSRIHVCTDCSPEPSTQTDGDTTYFDWGGNEVSLGIVFDLSTVEQKENLHPEFLYLVARNGEQLEDSAEPSAGHWINCDTLADSWGCSPSDVVEAINKKGLNLDAHYPGDFFQYDTLDRFSVHSVDLAKFEHKHAEYLESLKPPTTTPTCPKPPLATAEVEQLSGEIKRLKTELAEVRTENERLSEKPPKTQAANEGRDHRTAERWKGYLSVGVKVTAEIMQNDVHPYTKRELIKMCKKYGGDWGENSAQMKALRESLPKEYVNSGGAPKQTPE